MPIRLCQPNDQAAIVEIYNEAVSTGYSTADTQAASIRTRQPWFKEHASLQYPILVDVDGDDDRIRGWCSLSPYRKGRHALRFTAEISYYVSGQHKRRGVATGLISYATQLAIELGYKTLFAIVLENNQPSIQLLRKTGFEKWGFLPRIADFEGSECGHFYFGKRVLE